MVKLTKIMLTLALLVMGVTGAKAAETTIYTKDYSTATTFDFWNGSPTETTSVSVTDGLLVISNTAVQAETYTLQLHIGEGITTQEGCKYIVKIDYKATIENVEGSNNVAWVALGDWGKSQTNYWVPLTQSDDFQSLTLEFDGDGDGFKYSGTSNSVMWQSGKIVGTIYIKKVEVIEIAPDPVTETSVYTKDYSSDSNIAWSAVPADASVNVTDGQLVIVNDKKQTYNWDLQLHVGSGITTQAGLDYKVKIEYKSTVAGGVTVALGTWDNSTPKYGVPITISEDFQTLVLDFKEYQWSATDNFVMWQCGDLVGTIYIKKVEVIEIAPADPLALPKETLSEEIALAKKYSSIVYTSASFAELTSKITAAESALTDEDATAESLENATNALTTAISGLQLAVGYSTLTEDMYKNYTSLDNPVETSNAGCENNVGVSTGQPYGDTNVYYLNWADLSAYEKLVILVADGTPRIMMNRQEPLPEGSEGYDSHGGAYVQLTDAPVDGVVEVDLTQYSYVHLNAIKGANYGNVTVLGMYLYRDMSYGIIGDLTGGYDAADVDMTPTATEGEYTLTVPNVPIANVAAYKYKLRANDVWGDYELPAEGDYTWTPEDGIGIYTFTFTANVLNHTLNCVGEKTADFEYAVVGCTYEGSDEVQSALFAGTKAWDTNTTDVMTKQADGTYVWKKNEVTLPAKWIDLKVVARNGENVVKWFGNQDNGENVGLNINETGEGIYYVTVNFNGNYVTATAEQKGIYTVAGCYLVGETENDSFFGEKWNPAYTANDMTRNDEGIYELKFTDIELTEAGTIKYKVTQDHGWTTAYPQKDATWGVNEAGTYDITFTFNPTTKAVGCNLAIKKEISEAGYATYYSSYGLDFAAAGLSAYIAKINEKVASFDPIDNAPANTGVLLKGAKGTYKLPIVTSTTDVTDNAFLGSVASTQIPAGSFVLMNGGQGVGFYKTNAEFTLTANTAYLSALPTPARFIALDGETTAIEGIAAEKTNNGEVYNLQGQRVVKAQKGLYIVNGKKVLVK